MHVYMSLHLDPSFCLSNTYISKWLTDTRLQRAPTQWLECTCHFQSKIIIQWLLIPKPRLWMKSLAYLVQLYEEQDEWDHAAITHPSTDQSSRALEILQGRGQNVE